MGNRRNFIKTLAIAGIASSLNLSCTNQGKSSFRNKFLRKDNCLKITGTFIDELSHDLPFHNWGKEEWNNEFRLMKSIGIDTVILRHAGLDLKLLYPSKFLAEKGIPQPSFDKLELLLTLADKWGFNVFCGLYNAQLTSRLLNKSVAETNHAVSAEIWQNYGSRHRSFNGWFICQEISVENRDLLPAIIDLCKHCKSLAAGKDIIVSPWIDGNRLIAEKTDGTSSGQEYEAQWDEIMAELSTVVDICTVQDTSVNDIDCANFYKSCNRIARNHGINCWGNAETYDVQMPVRLYSTDFDHLRLKLGAAMSAGLDKVITYEFSHFMSPQSVCQSGSCLLDRYKEYFDIS